MIMFYQVDVILIYFNKQTNKCMNFKNNKIY